MQSRRQLRAGSWALTWWRHRTQMQRLSSSLRGDNLMLKHLRRVSPGPISCLHPAGWRPTAPPQGVVSFLCISWPQGFLLQHQMAGKQS